MDLTEPQAAAFAAVIAAIVCVAEFSLYETHPGKAVVLCAAGIALVLAVYFHTRIKQ